MSALSAHTSSLYLGVGEKDKGSPGQNVSSSPATLGFIAWVSLKTASPWLPAMPGQTQVHFAPGPLLLHP